MPLGACSVSRRDKHPTLNPYSQHEHLTQRQRQPAEARRPTTERRKTSRLPSPVLQLPPSDRRCAVTSFTMSNNPTTETGTQRTQRPIPSNHRHPKTLAPRADAQDRKIRCPGSLRDPMPRIAPRSDAGDFSIPDRQLPTPERRRSPGGGERIRTADPLLAKQVLSQLSYAPGSADRNRRTANRRSVARRPMSVVRYSDREGMRRRRRTPEQTTADGRPRTDRRHRGCKRPKNQGIQANDNPSPALVLRPPVP